MPHHAFVTVAGGEGVDGGDRAPCIEQLHLDEVAVEEVEVAPPLFIHGTVDFLRRGLPSKASARLLNSVRWLFTARSNARDMVAIYGTDRYPKKQPLIIFAAYLTSLVDFTIATHFP